MGTGTEAGEGATGVEECVEGLAGGGGVWDQVGRVDCRGGGEKGDREGEGDKKVEEGDIEVPEFDEDEAEVGTSGSLD